MLHSGPRDVADTILDDLVELQIEGPDSSCEAGARSGARPGVVPAYDDLNEPEARFEHAFASEQAWEPVEPRDLPNREQVAADDVEPALSRELTPEAEHDAEPPSVIAEPQPCAAVSADEPAPAAAETAVVSMDPEDASIDEPDEALVLRSLLAECGSVVRWLCTKAEEGQLQSADIEVARSFLVMAGLPTHNASTIGQAQIK